MEKKRKSYILTTTNPNYPNKEFRLFDSHCHPTDDFENLDHLEKMETNKIALMGTSPKDWERIINASQKYKSKTVFGVGEKKKKRKSKNKDKNLTPFFNIIGIHPWYAHLYSENEEWKDLLIKNLNRYPDCIVGEIGLDKVVKKKKDYIKKRASSFSL